MILADLQIAALNLFVALVCGVLIGTERQARKRMAGVRTNALVALGAAAFVIYAVRTAGDASPTRVAAQVVSGIGFLGAGIIYRDGFSVQGLNTAATLWCSAAIGVMAGSGTWHLAFLMTGFVVFVNLGLRPFVSLLKRKTGEGLLQRSVTVSIQCQADQERYCREQVIAASGNMGMKLVSISASKLVEESVVRIEASFSSSLAKGGDLDAGLSQLAGDPRFNGISWNLEDEA